MDDTSPKISFIPKGSLVHEESFLERPRPRSAIGIAAIFIFVVVLLGYGGLYFYNNFLEGQISDKLGEIEKVQKVFSESPQVAKANDFRFRAEIVRQLLDAHVAVSPIFKFLSENTVGSIMYNKFSFSRDGDTTIVKLSGEAPTYSSLAFQKEVFKQKTQTVSSFVVSNVALTSFGTVSFDLSISFNPDYLSYSKNFAGTSVPAGLPVLTPQIPPVLVPTPNVSNPGPVISLPSVQPVGSGVGARVVLPPAISTSSSSKIAAPLMRNTQGAVSTTSVPAMPVSSTTIGGGAASVPAQVVAGGAIQQSTPVPVATLPSPAATPTFWASFWTWFKFW